MAIQRAAPGAVILSAEASQALEKLMNDGVDLILFNRELGGGFPQGLGMEAIRALRPLYPKVNMMLVSNYPEAQADAEAAGAAPGFGKREIGTPKVTDRLRAALGL